MSVAQPGYDSPPGLGGWATLRRVSCNTCVTSRCTAAVRVAGRQASGLAIAL